MYTCLPYIVCVLSTTALWVWWGRKWTFHRLANAMFFPTVFAVVFVEGTRDFLLRVFGVYRVADSIVYSIVAIILVYVVVHACVALDLSCGWATPVENRVSATHDHNKEAFMAFLLAAGEEVGWRGYLLPCLMWQWAPPTALLISGVCWGLFHTPVMILLTMMLRPPRPMVTVIIQSLSCVLAAFPLGWLAIKCGFSVWPCAVMHAVWNRVNPEVLGSIYTQTPGTYTGQQWKINGEGLAGCVVYIPLCALVIYDLGF